MRHSLGSKAKWETLRAATLARIFFAGLKPGRSALLAVVRRPLSDADEADLQLMAIRLRPLAEQVILITGASSGIGLATARMAARRGAAVMLVARTGAALPSIVEGIAADGGRAAYAVADVGVRAEVEDAARKAIECFSRIDTWVNCAGVAIYAKLLDTPADEHHRLFQTNYFGTVHGALTGVRHLREQGGAVITVGSIASDFPSAIMGAYSASKHAAKAYIESLRIEINAERLPISVTLIKPLGTNTPIAEHAANHQDGEARIPPPVYDPNLVADAILDAAARPRLDVTVGGVGRLQALAATHFPGLYARFGGAVAPLLSDSRRGKTASDNFDAARAEARERSLHETGRTFSLYAPISRRPIVPVAATMALAVGVGVIIFRGLHRHNLKSGSRRIRTRV